MYDAVGVSVLASPVTSPRARESEFYYTLVFPSTRHSRASSTRDRTEPERVSYQHAVTLLRAITPGGKEREKRAVDEFRRAWERKFRCVRPAPLDTVPFVYFQELLREVIIQRFDAIPGLSFVTHVSADESQLVLSLRPSKALLAATADTLRLGVPAVPELDPGERYWAADPRRGQREREQLDKSAVQEELYRLFLAGKFPADEAQVFDGESAAMWSRRLRALQRFSDPEVARHLTTPPPPPASSLPFKNHTALQYLYRHIDGSDGGSGSPFRVVDKIRLTKAIVDTEFDCDALVAQRVLTHHLCLHTHHTDAVDTSVDVLRVQWGSLLSPWRVYRQGLVGLVEVLHYQPLVHVRNYFGEEIALYFAYTSFYAQWLQRLCVAIAALALLQSWRLKNEEDTAAAETAPIGRVHTLFGAAFCLVNCAFVQLFVRKWSVRERALASEWGVSDVRSSLQPRPQFRGEMERSPVNLRFEPQYSPAKRAAQQSVSYGLLLLLSAALLMAYHALLARASAFEAAVRGDAHTRTLQGSHVLLAVVTKLVGVPLAVVSTRLNDWENYKTQTDYDANLTLKFALLQTANGFGVLWFLTFVQPFVSRDACQEATRQLSCCEQATALLLTMLALDLVLTLTELRAPLYDLLCSGAHARVRRWLLSTRRRPRPCEDSDSQTRTLLGAKDVSSSRRGHTVTAGATTTRTDDDDDENASPLEAELALPPYEGVMLDYAQVIVSFGFVTWFTALSPAASVLAWAVAVLQLRVDTFKLSHATQRPFPAAKSSVGGWLLYLRFLSLTSLLHNAALAWMLWVEQDLHDQRDLYDLFMTTPPDGGNDDLLTSETQALGVFAVFVCVWVIAGLPDQHDRATATLARRASERERFLSSKFLQSVDKVADAVRDALPPGRVFLNGVHRYVVTGDKADEDAADEVFDELQHHQLRVLDVEKRITTLRLDRASVGVLYVEVVRITILPIMDALTKAVDSFVQLRLQSTAVGAGPGSAGAAKPANTSVAKKNRSPQWREKFEFPLASLDDDDALELSVWDWELLGKNRRIGSASLRVVDVVSRTFTGSEAVDASPTRSRQATAATIATISTPTTSTALLPLVMGTFELSIEMPEELLRSMAAADLERYGLPRLQLRCGVQLQELGGLLVRRRRLRRTIDALKARETRFVQWPQEGGRGRGEGGGTK